MNTSNHYFQKKRALRGVLIPSAISATGAAAYAMAYHFDYDTTLRHFSSSSILIYISVAILAIAAAWCTICAISLKGKASVKRSADPCPSETFCLWFSAFMFIAYGIISLTDRSRSISSGFGAMAEGTLLPLAFLSAFPFAMAASERLRGSTLHRISSIVPVMWTLALMLRYYFDLSDMPINDPELSITLISAASLVIFLLTEARRALGTLSVPLAVFGSGIAAILCGSVTLARIILFIIDGYSLPQIADLSILFTLSLTALSRGVALPSTIETIAAPQDKPLPGEE